VPSEPDEEISSGCWEILRKVEVYLDREVPTEEYERISEHLQGCSPCWERAEFQQRVRMIVASKCGQGAVPHSLLAKIRSSLESEDQTRYI
jgi:mycothiol system anti-sigma-R factor